jgi:YebC/PmpR family DNA-binding regulatory protein
MAGHNKWTQIKRQKAVTDGKKSKLFGMLAKTITLEVKKAGGDVNAAGVKRAVERARAGNMPTENIERALAKGSGGGAELTEMIYEAYGPGGVAILIEALTDNTTRTAQELKHLFNEQGGNLATPGAVKWAFTKTETGWAANNKLPVEAAEAEKLNNLLAALAENEDIREVFTNLESGQ